MEEPLFIGESYYQRIAGGIFQAFCIGLAVYSGFHFEENPVVVSVFIILMLFIFLIVDNTTVFVYADRIEFHDINFWLPFKKWKRAFYYNEIAAIETDLKFKLSDQIHDDFNPSVYRISEMNKITFKFKNGEQKIVSTKLIKSELVKALKHVDEATKGRFELHANQSSA